MRGPVLGAALLLLSGAARASPIRANTPGTGVYQGSGVLAGVSLDHKAGGGDWSSLVSFLELRYTPATHWVFGARVPYGVETRLERPGRARESTQGLGDVVVTAKHRFYRAVGPWRDRQAAFEAGIKLPTGSTRAAVSPGLSAADRVRLQPGTGSTDYLIDGVYQQAQGRWGAAADLGYRYNTEGEGGFRAGNEVRLNAGVQYILLPRIYEQPGHELFVLLEGTALRKSGDRLRRAGLPGTDRVEVLLAPGLQYVATEQLFLDLSLQLPLWSDLGGAEPRSRWNLLAQLRYAF